MDNLQVLKEKLGIAERALRAAQFEHAKALYNKEAAQVELRKAMGACYEPTVPDVMLPEWTYMRPNKAQEAAPEPLAALMHMLGTGGDISEQTVLCSIHAENDTTSLRNLLAMYPHLRIIVNELQACAAAAQEAARRSDESNVRVKKEQYMCAVRRMMLIGATSGTQQWGRHPGDGPSVNPKEIDEALKSGVLQDTELFSSVDGAAMKSAAQIVSEWRECEIGLQLIVYIGKQCKGVVDLATISVRNIACWCYTDANGNPQGPYSAADYWGWVQNGHWPGSTVVHLQSVPEHSVTIDSLQSIIDKVMGEVAAVRHLSATSSQLPEAAVQLPAEMVAAASTKLRIRLAEIMQHKVLPNVVRKSMEEVLMHWLAERKAGRLPPPKPASPAVTAEEAEAAASEDELADDGCRWPSPVRQAEAQQPCGQLGNSQPDGGVPPPAAAAAGQLPDRPTAPVPGQRKPAASWDAAVAAFDGGIPLHASRASRADRAVPLPSNGSQNGASEASSGGWPPCSGLHPSGANGNGWPPGTTKPAIGTAAMVNGGVPGTAAAPQPAAQGWPGRRRSRWDSTAPVDSRLQNGLSSSGSAGRSSNTRADHSSSPACVLEQRAAKLPRNGQVPTQLMSGRDLSTPHATHLSQDGRQDCKCSEGMSECQPVSYRGSLSYQRWLANRALDNVEVRFCNIPWKVFQIVGESVKARQQKQREEAQARHKLSGTAAEAALTDATASASGAAEVQGASSPASSQACANSAAVGADALSRGVCQAPENGAASRAALPSQGACHAPANGTSDGSHLAAIRTVAQPLAGSGALPNGHMQSGATQADKVPGTDGVLRRSSSGKHEPIRFSPPISSPPRKSVWGRMSPRANGQPAPVWDRLAPKVQASAAKADMSPSPASPPQKTPSPLQMPASVRRARVRVNLLNGGREAAPEAPASRGHTPDQASPVQEPVLARDVRPDQPPPVQEPVQARELTPDQASLVQELLQAQDIQPEVHASPAKQPAPELASRAEGARPTVADKEQAAAVQQQLSAAVSVLQAGAPQLNDSAPQEVLLLSLQQSLFPAELHGGSQKAALGEQLSQDSRAADVAGLSSAAEAQLCGPSSSGANTAAADHVSTDKPLLAVDTGAEAAACTSAPCADSTEEAAVANAALSGTAAPEAGMENPTLHDSFGNAAPPAASKPPGASIAPKPHALHAQQAAADSQSAHQVDSAADGCSLAGDKDSAGVQLAIPAAAGMVVGDAEADVCREGTSSPSAQAAPAGASEDRAQPEDSTDAVSISGTDEDEDDVCGPNDLVVGTSNGKRIILRDYTIEEFREACLGIKELLRARGRGDQIRPVAEAAAAEAAAAAAAAASDESDDQSQDESGSESSDESEYTPDSAEATPGKRHRGNDTLRPAKKRSRQSGSLEAGDDYEGDSCHLGREGGVAKPLGKGALRELMGLACDMDSLPVRSAVQPQPATYKESSEKQQHAPVKPQKAKHPSLKGKVTKPRTKAKSAPNGKVSSKSGKRPIKGARKEPKANQAADRAAEQYEGVCSRALPLEAVSRKSYLAAQARQAAAAHVSAQPAEAAALAEGRAGRLQVRQLARSDVTQDLATWQKLQGRADDLRLGRSGVHAWGLFARKPIPGNEFVIEYVGELIRRTVNDVRERADADSDYRFRVDADWVVDATRRGGKARFINHCCDPNCYTKTVSVNGQLHIMICSKRLIQEGEELTYDYKFQPTPGEAPIPCTCGAKNCRKRLN